MTITAFVNRAAGLRIHHIAGRATTSEFSALLRAYHDHPRVAIMDIFNLLEDDAEIIVSADEMAALRDELTAVYALAMPAVIIRSAWICPSVRAWPVLEDWLRDRHSLDGLATEVCLVAELDGAIDIFDPDEIAMVRHSRGFELLGRFKDND